jgi:hypothetical protein
MKGRGGGGGGGRTVKIKKRAEKGVINVGAFCLSKKN